MAALLRVLRTAGWAAAAFGLTAAALFCALGAGDALTERRATAVKAEVTALSRQCYALEGRYPPNLDYLTKKYGLKQDGARFDYEYEITYDENGAAIGAPFVKVTPREKP